MPPLQELPHQLPMCFYLWQNGRDRRKMTTLAWLSP